MSGEAYVYLSGSLNKTKPVWYRLDVDPPSEKDEKISPAAVMDPNGFARVGVWTACGEHIYWAGGLRGGYLRKHLYRHNPKDHKTWLPVANNNSRPLPRADPFIFPNHAQKKLYFLGGYVRAFVPHDDDDDNDDNDEHDWNNLGEVYDIVKGTWTTIPVDIKELDKWCSHHYYASAVVVKDNDDDEEPTLAVFYTIAYGGQLKFFDIVDGGRIRTECHPKFAIRPGTPPSPAIHLSQSVATKDTLYWFNVDMCLYGYDYKKKEWLKSDAVEDSTIQKFLEERNQLTPKEKYLMYPGFRYPLLIGLNSTRFFVIFDKSNREFLLASLNVEKGDNSSLSVSVDSTKKFYTDDPCELVDGIAMLKNA